MLLAPGDLRREQYHFGSVILVRLHDVRLDYRMEKQDACGMRHLPLSDFLVDIVQEHFILLDTRYAKSAERQKAMNARLSELAERARRRWRAEGKRKRWMIN